MERRRRRGKKLEKFQSLACLSQIFYSLGKIRRKMFESLFGFVWFSILLPPFWCGGGPHDLTDCRHLVLVESLEAESLQLWAAFLLAKAIDFHLEVAANNGDLSIQFGLI